MISAVVVIQNGRRGNRQLLMSFTDFRMDFETTRFVSPDCESTCNAMMYSALDSRPD